MSQEIFDASLDARISSESSHNSVFDASSVSEITDWAENVSALISETDADTEPNAGALMDLAALKQALQNYEKAGEGDRSMFEETIKEKARELYLALKKG